MNAQGMPSGAKPAFSPKMKTTFKKIVIDRQSAGSKMAARVCANLPGADVEIRKDILKAMSAEGLSRATLLLTTHQGRFVKDFPSLQDTPPCGEKYVITLLNCPYRCCYCYLQSYLDHGNIVIFTNTGRMKREVLEALESEPPERITTGEMGDSLAIDHITGTTFDLLPLFEGTHTTLEVRTKSDNVAHLIAAARNREEGFGTADGEPSARLPSECLENLLITWTLGPAEAAKKEELGAAGLSERLAAIERVSKAGLAVAVRFDPIIPYYYDSAKYREILAGLASASRGNVRRFELGVLRFPHGLWEHVRAARPESRILRGEFHRDSNGKTRLYRPRRIAIYRELYRMVREFFSGTPVELSMEPESVWRDAGIPVPRRPGCEKD